MEKMTVMKIVGIILILLFFLLSASIIISKVNQVLAK
jgi:hypothetical protein